MSYLVPYNIIVEDLGSDSDSDMTYNNSYSPINNSNNKLDTMETSHQKQGSPGRRMSPIMDLVAGVIRIIRIASPNLPTLRYDRDIAAQTLEANATDSDRECSSETNLPETDEFTDVKSLLRLNSEPWSNDVRNTQIQSDRARHALSAMSCNSLGEALVGSEQRPRSWTTLSSLSTYNSNFFLTEPLYQFYDTGENRVS